MSKIESYIDRALRGHKLCRSALSSGFLGERLPDVLSKNFPGPLLIRLSTSITTGLVLALKCNIFFDFNLQVFILGELFKGFG